MTRSLRGLAAALAAAVVGIAILTMGIAWHEGYRAYIVRTGSMVPTFRPGDAVVDKPVGAGYAVGDSITVEVAPGTLVTHRFHSRDAQGKLLTKGDANKKQDAWRLNPSQVRGVVARALPKMGYAMVFLRQKAGVGGVMTSALALILLWGICFPSEEETPESPTTPRIPRQRRGPFVRIPRQRAAGEVADEPVDAPGALQRRMPPTPPPSSAPMRRLPPVPPPARRGPLAAVRVPRPRTV